MRTRILSAWLVGALPLPVLASEAPVQGTDQKGAPQVGGTSTIDHVALKAGSLGAPLRFGHIIQGSEKIQFNGRSLSPGTDYAIDYEAGVVYLKLPQRTGDTLTASYRYDSQGKATSSNSFQGINQFGFNVAPGMGLIGGLGVTERAADGSVLSSNLYGWNNALKFGGNGSLSGLFLMANRQKNTTQAGLNLDTNARPGDASTEEGTSQFLLQSFRSNLMGGNVQVDYQDISKNFASASQVRSAGYSDADVARLMKERGLTRQSMALTGMQFGGSKIGASFSQVGDQTGGVERRGLDLAQGAFSFSMKSQSVDKTFTRFDDLSDGDRAQLKLETGLSRETMAMAFNQKTAKLSFTSNSVSDDSNSKGLVRREARLDAGKIGLTFGEQEVDKAFGRVASLTGDEKNRYGREVGIKRQWMGLNSALDAKSGTSFAFNQLGLESTNGNFMAQDATVKSRGWTLDHVRLSGDKDSPIRSLQDAEANAFVKRIGGFFDTPNTNDGHRNSLLAAGNVTRDLTRVTGSLSKSATFKADQLKFGEGDTGGVATSVAITTPKITASFRNQDFGKKFSDASRLMEFERNKLGTLAGLQRTDVSLGIQLDKTRRFEFGQMTAGVGEGSLDRTTMAYSAKGLEVKAAQRRVDKDMAYATSLVDGERDLLNQFRGFQERDLGVKFAGLPGVKVEAFIQDALNGDTNEKRSYDAYNVDWQVDKLTGVSYQSRNSLSADPLATLFAQSYERMAFSRNLGKLGNLKLVEERLDNSGKNNASPDMVKQYFSLETKLDQRTSVRTEQTRTAFDNGDKENISANTVSTALSTRAGVSVTDISIDRKGDDNDENKRNYGIWYDFGQGLRLTYGFVRNATGDLTANGNETWTFGKTSGNLNANQMNQVGAANVGGILLNGGYAENTFQSASSDRTQSFANVGIATAKPLRFGSMTDVKFSFGLDSAADMAQYLRETHTAGFSGKLGKNEFSFGYRGQLATADQQAIDRSFALTTDPSAKNPIVLNGSIKLRTLPNEQEYTSRNFAVTARPLPGVEITNQVQSNLEQADGNVLLGSRLLADRANRWALNFKGSADTTFGASWEEKINDTTFASSTVSGVNLTLFQKSGSPLRLFYGMEEIQGNVSHRLTSRYTMQFDQKVSINQTFSLYVGNTNYRYNITDDLQRDNWTMRLNYQIRF